MLKPLFAIAILASALPLPALAQSVPRAVGTGESNQTVDLLGGSSSVTVESGGALDTSRPGAATGGVGIGIATPLGAAGADGATAEPAEDAAPATPEDADPLTPAPADDTPIVPGGAVPGPTPGQTCLVPVGTPPDALAILALRAFRLIEACPVGEGERDVPVGAVAEHPLLAGWLERQALGAEAVVAVRIAPDGVGLLFLDPSLLRPTPLVPTQEE